MGAAAAVDAADEPLVVPNLACRRSTSRGGLATELTNAILTCRPVKETEHKPLKPGTIIRFYSYGVILKAVGPHTFGFVGVSRADVLSEQPQTLLSFIMKPQVHLPPRLVLLRRLAFKVPLTVTHPQLVRVLRKPLKEEGHT